MPATSIPSIQEAQNAYVSGTSANANKWERRTAQAAPVWEANAKSAEAEQAYAKGVQMAAQNQLRLKGLQSVTAASFSSAVSGRSGAYREKTAARAGKWASKFSPYLDTIKSIVPSLPARVPGDVSGNIDRRVKPIAQALHQQKVGGGGGFIAPRSEGYTVAGRPFGGY